MQSWMNNPEDQMHVVQMRQKPELKFVVPAPKVRLPVPSPRGGQHRDKRRRARSTERALLRKEIKD